jgi:hypothetical protein
MRILRNLVLAVAVVLVLLLVVAFFLPARFSVEGSTVIAAPAGPLYASFATPRTWARWSAWTTAADSTLVYTYAGPDSGAGAIMRFTARKMGNGELEIVEAVPASLVRYELRLAGTDMKVAGRVTFAPAAGGTQVTWNDSGDLGRNVLLRYLRPVLEKNLAAAYQRSFAGLRREVAAQPGAGAAPTPAAP